MSRSAEEIRQLQARVYGRDGKGSRADIARLAQLTALPSAGHEDSAEAPAAPSSSAAHVATEAPADETHDVEVARRRSFVTSRPVVVGAFLVTLCGGIAGGLAIAAAVPSEPMRITVPPNAEIYHWDSIMYYGEIDGVYVWTAKLAEDNRDCLIAMDNAGAGAGNCVEDAARILTIDLPSANGAGSYARVTMDFSDPRARPVVGSRPA